MFFKKKSGLFNNLQTEIRLSFLQLLIHGFTLFSQLFPQHCRRGGDYQSCTGEPSGWTGQRGDQVGRLAGHPHTNGPQQQHE